MSAFWGVFTIAAICSVSSPASARAARWRHSHHGSTRARIFWSSPSRPASHQVNANNGVIGNNACAIAGPAALTRTERLIDAPSRTSPVLMKNSVRKPPDSRSRRPVELSTMLPSRSRTIA
ncbi:hypothetical protein [Actinophytocola oryzae]|uniref:hypothetical protein n=1 Tax=Actinophytocola oryzae TaxID=502181 RepID=UPI001414CCCF|nr:hypothetical protein [Actinophytocola oryzae]